MPLPQCFADGVGWLLGQLPQRGYPELNARLTEFLNDFGERSISVDRGDGGALNSMNMDARRP